MKRKAIREYGEKQAMGMEQAVVWSRLWYRAGCGCESGCDVEQAVGVKQDVV